MKRNITNIMLIGFAVAAIICTICISCASEPKVASAKSNSFVEEVRDKGTSGLSNKKSSTLAKVQSKTSNKKENVNKKQSKVIKKKVDKKKAKKKTKTNNKVNKKQKKIDKKKIKNNKKQKKVDKKNKKKKKSKVKKLTRAGGVNYYNGRKETWYSQRVLPGKGLKIPGRHVAKDGTIRDKDNYIVVAASDLKRGTVVKTSLGKGKVYDCGCPRGVTDIYTNW